MSNEWHDRDGRFVASRPIDTIEVPDDSEPEDNVPDAVSDRLAWDDTLWQDS